VGGRGVAARWICRDSTSSSGPTRCSTTSVSSTAASAAFILGRYGDWGSERYPGYFTGDTYSQWPVLAYEVAFTARGGNVLVPYISHDIGGFHGAKIDFDLYARWIEFGAFSPILRMHSAHANPREGNMRMPWIYGDAGVALMKRYFTLRTQLIPYLYTYTWLAHRDATPLLRPLYLPYPQLEEAYQHSHEYLLGDEMLVAPIVTPSGDETIYLPPGEWFDFFTGKTPSRSIDLHCTLRRRRNPGVRARRCDHSRAATERVFGCPSARYGAAAHLRNRSGAVRFIRG
jgi:alpha-glucosidase (family GH31 glycosyl hydrolase)